MKNISNETFFGIGLILCSIAIIGLVAYIYSIPSEPLGNKELKPNLNLKSCELTIDTLKSDNEYLEKQLMFYKNKYDGLYSHIMKLEAKLLECKDAYEFILSHCEDY